MTKLKQRDFGSFLNRYLEKLPKSEREAFYKERDKKVKEALDPATYKETLRKKVLEYMPSEPSEKDLSV